MSGKTPLKVYIASGDSDELQQLSAMLDQIGLQVAGIAKSGTDAFSGAIKTHADLLLADFALSDGDGLEVCRRLKETSSPPVVFLLLPYISGFLSARLSKAAPDCFFLKPVNRARLEMAIMDFEDYRQSLGSPGDIGLEVRISEILRELGIPVKLLGHGYIRDALLPEKERELCLHGAMDRLYRSVAAKNSATPARIERNIRNAIEVAFDRCTPGILEKYFGNTVRFDRGKPTNSEFLSCIAEKLVFESRTQPAGENRNLLRFQ